MTQLHLTQNKYKRGQVRYAPKSIGDSLSSCPMSAKYNTDDCGDIPFAALRITFAALDATARGALLGVSRMGRLCVHTCTQKVTYSCELGKDMDLTLLLKYPHLEIMNISGLGSWYTPWQRYARTSGFGGGSYRDDRAAKICLDPWRKISEIRLGPGWHEITQLINLQGLDISFTDVTDEGLALLAPLTNLRTLYIRSCYDVTEVPLASLTNLHTLNISGCSVSNTVPLASLANLQTLNISCTNVVDLSPLADLIKLQELDISHTFVIYLAPLTELTKLQKLYMHRCERLSKVNPLVPLARLINLEELELSCNNLICLAPLAGLTKLKKLTIFGYTRVENLAPLAGLTNLREIDISGCNTVKNLAPLASLTNLQTLNINYMEVEDPGLAPLADLINLRELEITDIGDDDKYDLALAPLTHLINLQFDMMS